MVLTIHHLQVSQSERLPWLCEELSIPYELRRYKRSPLLSPPAYIALHPLGAAPVITDGPADQPLTLAESAACVEYIVQAHGGGRLMRRPAQAGYVDFLYWWHFSNGTLQPAIARLMTLRFAGCGEESNVRVRAENKVHGILEFLDQRVGATGAWVAGAGGKGEGEGEEEEEEDGFTAADIMIVFSLTTMRRFCPLDLSRYENILAYLRRVSEREGYRRAMAKSDPEMDVEDLIRGPPPAPFEGLQRK